MKNKAPNQSRRQTTKTASTHPRTPLQTKKSQSHKPPNTVSKWVFVVALLMGVAVALAISLAVVQTKDSSCDDSFGEKYTVTLEVVTDAPEMQTTNSSTVYLNGSSSTSWIVQRGRDEGAWRASLGATGWFQKAIRIGGYIPRKDGQEMTVRAYVHNEMTMQDMLSTAPFLERTLDMKSLVCDPPFASITTYSVPMGGSSDGFVLGTCRVTRKDEGNLFSLEPYEIEVNFSARVHMVRGTTGVHGDDSI